MVKSMRMDGANACFAGWLSDESGRAGRIFAESEVTSLAFDLEGVDSEVDASCPSSMGVAQVA
jgi:hypothetical protein